MKKEIKKNKKKKASEIVIKKHEHEECRDSYVLKGLTMNDVITVEDYVNVKKKAQKLGLNIPSQIAILPLNFETATTKEELIHASITPTVRKLWRQNNIQETPIEKPGEKIPCIAQEGFEWIGPIIFVAFSLWSQNSHLVNMALNLISNYLTDWFRGIPSHERQVELNIVSENRFGECKKVEYKGTLDGFNKLLEKLPEILKEIHETHDEE